MTPLTRCPASQSEATLTGRGSVPAAWAGALVTARPAPVSASTATRAAVRRGVGMVFLPAAPAGGGPPPAAFHGSVCCEDVERQVLRLAAPGERVRPTVAGQRRTWTGFPRPPT